MWSPFFMRRISMQKSFKDRVDAGMQLAQKLMQYKNDPNGIVLGLPRGGVPVAAEVANALHVPLDIVVTRKIGAPFNEELAVGALTQDGDVIWNEMIMQMNQLTPEDLTDTIAKETKEAQRRLQLYRHGRRPLELKGKTVFLIDDGIATGATMRAAIQYAKMHGAAKIIVAVPVAVIEAFEALKNTVDEMISLLLPKIFLGVGAFYDSFGQTSDQEVITIMQSKR